MAEKIEFIQSVDFLTNLLQFLNPNDFIQTTMVCKSWNYFIFSNPNSSFFKEYYISAYKESSDVKITECTWYEMIRTRSVHINITKAFYEKRSLISYKFEQAPLSNLARAACRFYSGFTTSDNAEDQYFHSSHFSSVIKTDHEFQNSRKIYLIAYDIDDIKNIKAQVIWYAKTKMFSFKTKKQRNNNVTEYTIFCEDKILLQCFLNDDNGLNGLFITPVEKDINKLLTEMGYINVIPTTDFLKILCLMFWSNTGMPHSILVSFIDNTIIHWNKIKNI